MPRECAKGRLSTILIKSNLEDMAMQTQDLGRLIRDLVNGYLRLLGQDADGCVKWMVDDLAAEIDRPTIQCP